MSSWHFPLKKKINWSLQKDIDPINANEHKVKNCCITDRHSCSIIFNYTYALFYNPALPAVSYWFGLRGLGLHRESSLCLLFLMKCWLLASPVFLRQCVIGRGTGGRWECCFCSCAFELPKSADTNFYFFFMFFPIGEYGCLTPGDRRLEWSNLFSVGEYTHINE